MTQTLAPATVAESLTTRAGAPGSTLAAPARLLGVGTAVPPHSYTQEELLREFQISDPRIRSLFRNSAIERRHLCLPPRDPAGGRRIETQGELLQKHTRTGLAIGREAIVSCLRAVGAKTGDVRYLCCVTSTGYLTPGFSALLIKDLGLRPDCSRLDVVGMGCSAGLNALAAATGWASMHPGQLALMVCIEACSAAYVFDNTMRTAVVNSLFGDGAAAVALAAGGGGPTLGGTGASLHLLRFASCLIPEAISAMRYDWDSEQQKFSFFLDPDIPYVIGANVEHSLRQLLDGTDLRHSDIRHWIIHSGGKKVIDAVRVNLGLTRHDVRHTASVLRDYGNLSSGSFLFSYQRLLNEGTEPGDHGVLMTMGPGSTIETALVRWVR